MATMNRQLNTRDMQRVAATLEAESAKAAIGEEMMDDVYDAVFEGSEGEAESHVMDQLYDEIGLECAQAAPTTSAKTMAKTESVSDEQIEAFIRSQARTAPANQE